MKQFFFWFQNLSLGKRATILSFVCLVYTFIFATPPFTSIIYPEKNVYWNHISKQMDHPFTPINHGVAADHEAKVGKRLLVPIIGFLLPTSDNRIRFGFIILLKAILGFLFFQFLYKKFSKGTIGNWIPELMTFGFVTLYLGKSFISEYMWFDEFAFFLTTLALFSCNPFVVIVAIIAACFTDERAYFSLLFVFGYKLYKYFHERGQKTGIHSFMNVIALEKAVFVKQVAIIPLTMMLCIGFRIILTTQFGLVTSVNDGGIVFFDYFKNGNIDYMQLGLFAAFKIYWVFIFWVLWFFWKTDKFVCVFMLCSLGLTIIASVSVWDLSRSLTFSFPLLIISYLLLDEWKSSLNKANHVVFSLVIATLLAVNFFITPVTVSDNVNTDHNLLIKIYEHFY